MTLALAEATAAFDAAEVPVGAVIVHQGQALVQAHNRVEAGHDPTAHAEILAIRAAAAVLGTPRLVDCDL
jgi:tRNA(adenine34) deaminase